jgi:hypothetical protein
MYGTVQAGVFNDVETEGTIGASTFSIDKLTIATGGGLSGYRSSGCVVVDCNGIDDVVVTLTADISAGTWTFKELSYIEVIRIN